MQVTDENTASHHQEASAHYLQGRFAEALAIWRQLLAANSHDERAQEGVRLCELLTEEATEAAPQEAEAAAQEAEPVEFVSAEQIKVPDVIDLQIPDLDIDLNSETPDPERQMEGLNLGEVPETLSLAGNPPETPPEIPGEEPISDEVVEHDATPTPGTVEGTTESELKTRVQNLLVEANAAYKEGDHDKARSVLARVFILDETDAQALAMQERLDSGEFEPADASADFVDGFDLAPDVPVEDAQSAVDPALVADSPASDAALDDDELDSMDIVDPAADAEFDPPEAASHAARRVTSPQPNVGGKASRIVIGAVIVVVAAVGIGVLMKLRSGKIQEGDAPVPPQANATAPAAVQGDSPIGETPADARRTPPAPAVAAGNVDTLLSQGREAYDAGEFAAAIVAYYSVLAQQPSNVEAIGRMEEATEAYHQQQAIQEQWVAATSLYQDGDYRSAMKMFYRLPVSDDADRRRLERYKENGWYNLGVLALRGAQCDLARSHLNEAQQIDPKDAGMSTAQALLDSCDANIRKKRFQRAAAALPLRGLDD